MKWRFLNLSRIKISFEIRKLFISLSQTMSRDFDENLMDLEVLNQCPRRIFFQLKKEKQNKKLICRALNTKKQWYQFQYASFCLGVGGS